jgi:hypothetical protein
LGQARIDAVLLAAAVPRGGHLGPDAAHAIVAGEDPLTRGGHGSVPLHIAHAMAPDSLAHVLDEALRCIDEDSQLQAIRP